MFLGEFEYKIDDKGRALIPPAFRQELQERVVLTAGVEQCVTAYPVAEWEKIATSLTTGSITRSKLRRLNRAIFAAAFNLRIDEQGRIAIPAPLREHAGIGNEVIIIGANTYFELWNKEQWQSEKTISREETWQNIESLEQR